MFYHFKLSLIIFICFLSYFICDNTLAQNPTQHFVEFVESPDKLLDRLTKINTELGQSTLKMIQGESQLSLYPRLVDNTEIINSRREFLLNDIQKQIPKMNKSDQEKIKEKLKLETQCGSYRCDEINGLIEKANLNLLNIERCDEAITSSTKKFSPEFLEIQSQLAKYRLAWTMNMLTSKNNLNLKKTLQESIIFYKNDFVKYAQENERDVNEMQDLLNYQSHWNNNQLANFSEYLYQLMKEESFQNKYSLNSQDIKDFGIQYSDIKTMEVLGDIFKNLDINNKNGSTFNLAQDVGASLKGREGLSSADRLFFQRQINKYEKKFKELGKKIWDEVHQVCGTNSDGEYDQLIAKKRIYFPDNCDRCKFTQSSFF